MRSYIGIIFLVALTIGCSPKSEIDKCVEAWEESVADIKDDGVQSMCQKDSDGKCSGDRRFTKKEARFATRQQCLRAAGNSG